MTKEFTGPEFEIEFARRWLDYVVGGKVGVDPHTDWEYKNNRAIGMDWTAHPHAPAFSEFGIYRWKPQPKRMVTIGYLDKDNHYQGKELVAPEVEAPEFDATVFYFTLEGISIALNWRGIERQLMLLNSGQIFLTREDAQAMAEWLAVCRKGEQE